MAVPMRSNRWGPFVALIAGAIGFVALVLVVIPTPVVSPRVTSSGLAQPVPTSEPNAAISSASATGVLHPGSIVAASATTVPFPKRGFSPPLFRPELPPELAGDDRSRELPPITPAPEPVVSPPDLTLPLYE